MRPQKSMGDIVIDIWEKSNFFGSFWSQKGAKNAIFVQGGFKSPPLMVGLRTSDPKPLKPFSTNYFNLLWFFVSILTLQKMFLKHFQIFNKCIGLTLCCRANVNQNRPWSCHKRRTFEGKTLVVKLFLSLSLSISQSVFISER